MLSYIFAFSGLNIFFPTFAWKRNTKNPSTSQWLCSMSVFVRRRDTYSHLRSCIPDRSAPPCCCSGNCVRSPTARCPENRSEPSSPLWESSSRCPVEQGKRWNDCMCSHGTDDEELRERERWFIYSVDVLVPSVILPSRWKPPDSGDWR